MTQILIEQTRGAKRTNTFPEVWFLTQVVDIQIQIRDETFESCWKFHNYSTAQK